jgi:hypothetical protein
MVIPSGPDDLNRKYLPRSPRRHPALRHVRRPAETRLDPAAISHSLRQLLLLAEAGLHTGRLDQADRACAAARAAVQQIPVVDWDLVATVLAVDAHVCVGFRTPRAVQACRRYHAVAVDQYVAGHRRRLFYAQALNATLLASANPTVAADAFERLLRRPGLTADDTVVAQRALTAARARSNGTAAAPRSTPPPLPGGARLPLTGPPDPDCLAWLILAPTTAGACRPAACSRRWP